MTVSVSPSALALLAYASWTLALIVFIVLYRGSFIITKKRQANEFSPDGSDVSAFSHRLCRAHANCLENLPIFAAFILFAIVTRQTEVTNSLALVLVFARMGQSIVHLISTSAQAVMLRGTLFSIQLGILIWWACQFFL